MVWPCSSEREFRRPAKFISQFKLPQQSSSIRLSGQVVWQDWNGRAGVQFVDVPKASRRLLSDYLSENLPKNADSADSFTDVTVELEERCRPPRSHRQGKQNISPAPQP